MKKLNYTIDFSLAIFLLYIICILFSDYLVYFFNINYFLSLIFGLFVSIGFFCWIKKRVSFKNNFEKYDSIFFFLLFIIFSITIVFPDKMFDTLNYHLINQEMPFHNLLGNYFFQSSNINSTTYQLADRLFYPFRLLFGYRLGLIYNYLCMIIIYYQIKNILKNIFNFTNKYIITIVSALSIITLNVLDVVDTYYVDISSIILLLELFRLVISYENIIKKKSDKVLIYMAFLSGISFCFKFSNAFFIIVLFIVFIIKNHKYLRQITAFTWLESIVVFIFPFFVYMLNIYIQTGNPIFPFYNNIFKSKLMASVKWSDDRFGPKGIIETFMWPIICFRYPLRANDVPIVEPIFSYGYISSIIYITYYSIKLLHKEKINTKKFAFALTLFAFYIVWSKFVLGYIRYGLVILVLGNIMFFVFSLDILKLKKYFALTLIIVLLSFNSYYFFDRYVYKTDIYTFHNIFSEGKTAYIYNLKKIFFDRYDQGVEFPNNSAYGPLVFDSGAIYLENKKIPIINMFVHKENLDNDLYEKMISEKYNSYSNIYSGFPYYRINEFINNSNYFGFKILSIYKEFTPYYMSYNDEYYIFKIEKSSKNSNTFYTGKNFKINTDLNNFNLSGIIGSNTNYSLSYDTVKVVFIDNDSNIIDSIKLDLNSNKLYNINNNFSCSTCNNLYIKLVGTKNGISEDLDFIALNITLKNN